MKKKGTIEVTVLTEEDSKWHRAEVKLSYWDGWFPMETVFDVVGRKFVAPSYAPSLTIGRNFGSYSVGCGTADVASVTSVLKEAGWEVV